MSNIKQKTEQFEAYRKQLNDLQTSILTMPVVTNDEHVPGILEAMKRFSAISNNANDSKTVAKKVLGFSAARIQKTLNPSTQDGSDAALDFDNFYGPVVAQSMSAHSNFTFGKSNGLMDYRGVNKSLNTEGMGILQSAINTILYVNGGSNEEVDMGWIALYNVLDMTGMSSGKIPNFSMHLRVKKLPEGKSIENSHPISISDMQETRYSRYGISMLFSIIEQQLTDYFATAAGLNSVFTWFRTAMAQTKSSEAYRCITKKPGEDFIMEATDLVDKPDSTNSTYSERQDYVVDRFIHNITNGYRKFIKLMKEKGVPVRRTRPTIHCLFSPDAPGAMIVDLVLKRLADVTRPISMPVNLIFHESTEVPLSGAWVETMSGNKVVLDEDGFEVKTEAGSEDSFGVMLVLPGGGNIHGVNNALYNVSMTNPANETVQYFTFERFTFHADKNQRFWIRNIVPATESATVAIDTGE